MARDDKLTVKIQIKVTEEDKKNLDKDIPVLAKQVKDQVGTKITRSDFLRLVLDDLHKKILSGHAITWPPQLEVTLRPPKRRSSKKD